MDSITIRLRNVLHTTKLETVCLAAILLFFFGGVNSHSQQFERIIDGRGNSSDWSTDMVATADGGYAVCGYGDSTIVIDENNEIHIMFSIVTKLNANGTIQWKRKLEDWEPQVPVQYCAKAIAETNDNGFVVTGWRRDNPNTGARGPAFIVRLDPFGNVLWRKYYATYPTLAFSNQGSLCAGTDIMVKPDGHIIVAGVSNEVILNINGSNWVPASSDFCNNPSTGQIWNNKKVWFLELEEQLPDVNVITSRVFGVSNINGQSVSLKYVFDPRPINYVKQGIIQGEHIVSICRTDDDRDGTFGADDGYVIRVDVLDHNNGYSGIWLLKLDINANPQWSNIYQFQDNVSGFIGSIGQEVRSLLCQNGDIIVVGTLINANNRGISTGQKGDCYKKTNMLFHDNVLLLKVHIDGTIAFAQDYGDPDGLGNAGNTYSENGYAIDYDNNCNVYVFGGKFAHTLGEPGAVNQEHQAWVFSTTTNLPLRPIIDARSVGSNDDDHFVTGVYSVQNNAVSAAGHTSGYHTGGALQNDMFVVGLETTLRTGPCSNIEVKPCVNAVTAIKNDLYYYSCTPIVDEDYPRHWINDVDDWDCSNIP